MQKENNNSIKQGFEQTSAGDIIRQIKRHDYRLTHQEKNEVWNSIAKNTVNRKRQYLFSRISIAASLLIVIIGGWIATQYIDNKNNAYTDMSAKIDMKALHATKLYISEQEIELNEQVYIACNSKKGQLEITNRDGSKFAISVPNAKENPLLQIAVPQGKKATIILPDNSEVTIRENSKVIFPIIYNEKKREIYLEGEAFLNVTKNPQMQFNVKTSKLNVSVLGTSFNVSALANSKEQSVVLVTGKVNVTSESGESIIMKPNQKFTYNKALNKNTLTDINPYSEVCWKEEIIILNNEPLSSVFDKIGKHYNTNLSYNKNEMSRIKISGKLDVSLPLKELLDMITKISPTHISVKNKTIKINTNPNEQ